MWGQVTEDNYTYALTGIIPTRVGTSSAFQSIFFQFWDHPHACGDKAALNALSKYSLGSSPRVWGQASTTIVGISAIGIIPTRVGTRQGLKHFDTVAEDHPHACGDKAFETVGLWKLEGSSPRVWGQVVFHLRSKPVHRIIPTRVGTSFLVFCSEVFTKDHPHACGDKRATFLVRIPSLGSSPRVWGQGRVYIQICPDIRIIPTRVGTRSALHLYLRFLRDHPHACGDKYPSKNMLCSHPGSSPRVWGQGLYIAAVRIFERIIPTRVGTRVIADNNAIFPEDHPHACGDKVVHRKAKSGREGSSPRVWGQDADRLYQYDRIRIIPTRVGTS